MGRWNAESDLDYYAGVGYEPPQVQMHCVDCGCVVYISRDEPYPGPAFRCDECADKPALPVMSQKQGAA